MPLTVYESLSEPYLLRSSGYILLGLFSLLTTTSRWSIAFSLLLKLCVKSVRVTLLPAKGTGYIYNSHLETQHLLLFNVPLDLGPRLTLHCLPDTLRHHVTSFDHSSQQKSFPLSFAPGNLFFKVQSKCDELCETFLDFLPNRVHRSS